LNTARRHLAKEDRAALARRLRDETGWSNPVLAEHIGVSKETIRTDLLATGKNLPVDLDARVIDRNGASRPAAVPRPPAEPTVRTLIAAGLSTDEGPAPVAEELRAMLELYIRFGIKRFAPARVAALVDPDMREFYASVGEEFIPWLATFVAELRAQQAQLRVVGGSGHEAAEVGP
jgi:hypothetical protein